MFTYFYTYVLAYVYTYMHRGQGPDNFHAGAGGDHEVRAGHRGESIDMARVAFQGLCALPRLHVPHLGGLFPRAGDHEVLAGHCSEGLDNTLLRVYYY